MSKKFFYTLALIFIFACISSDSIGRNNKFLMIYRNDSLFNQIPSTKSEITGSYLHRHNCDLLNIESHDTSVSIPITAIDSCVLRSNSVPTMHLDFPDDPTVSQLSEKETWVNAYVKIDGHGICEDTGRTYLMVKGRGNSTWNEPKKPMRLKFDSKKSICGFKKAKNYVLLANYLDPTHVKNVIALWLAQRLNIPFSNHFIPVNVIINGNHQGLYLLTEKIGINGASVDIDDYKGILFELSSEFDEPYKFRSAIYDLPVMVKDPDFSELYRPDSEDMTPDERLKLWQDDFNNAEKAVSLNQGFEYFDLNSAVDYVMVMKFTNNSDNGSPKSFYIWKPELGKETKYILGPLWDFDSSFNTPRYNDGTVNYDSWNSPFWHNKLLAKMVNTPEFKSLYNSRLQEFCDIIIPELFSFIDNYSYFIEPSALEDGNIWPENVDRGWMYRLSSNNFRNEIILLKDWLQLRKEYILSHPY